MFKLFKVSGNSMLPQYYNNDYVISAKWIFGSLKIGDDVICHHESLGVIIKRIKKITHNKIEVTGLNSFSTNSRIIGDLDKKDIIGKVLWQFKSQSRKNN